jgi:hypothetical protein
MTRSAEELRTFAVARAMERRRAELTPLGSEIAAAIARVGWRRARPVIVSVLAPVPVSGPHGAWWERVGKRSGTRIPAGLRALSVQGRLDLRPWPQSQPGDIPS